MEAKKEHDLEKRINVVLFSSTTATRTGLESMLAFGSQQIEIHSTGSLAKTARAIQGNNYDVIILCICEVADGEIIGFIEEYPQIPVILIDNYYNRNRAENLLRAGALDYLDMSTLDSRLLIKTINFSIQRKNAENMALQAERRMKIRSTFLANMSHEIRTPLNSIIGFSELLYDDEADAVKREKLNMIRQSGKHLLTLINGILDFSKLEAGKIKTDEDDFSIDNLVMTLYYMMLVKAGDRNLDLNIKPVGKIPELVQGDEFRINQILINLMNNAIKFTEKGSVTLEYSYEKGLAVFKVIDTGIGIPPAKQEHIFDAFEQVYTTDYFQQQGTGLGLAISRNLVLLMKGQIKVESETGKGSTFCVKIPLPVVRWQADKVVIQTRNRFTARKLGIIYDQIDQKNAIRMWCENHLLDADWVNSASWQNPDFLNADLFLIPQDTEKNLRNRISRFLANDYRSSFKPKVFYYQKSDKLFFVINRKLISGSYTESIDKAADQNLKPDEFVNYLNYHFEMIESKGREMINIWKKNFEQENPGLEEVLFEAILRMHERLKDLNTAATANDHNAIEEIAHSLKGFTGQTCIYEISSRASILLDEMRSDHKAPHPEVIWRELSALNEIIYLLPRRFLGIKARLKAHPENAMHPHFPPMKILVAEDNPINQAVIKDFLKHFKLDCTLVSNGKEALEIMRQQNFDLLFLDIQMPVMNGMETLAELKKASLLENTFVVALTAYVMDIQNNELMKKNCDAFLSKPFEKVNLLEILQKAADKYEFNNNKKVK